MGHNIVHAYFASIDIPIFLAQSLIILDQIRHTLIYMFILFDIW